MPDPVQWLNELTFTHFEGRGINSSFCPVTDAGNNGGDEFAVRLDSAYGDGDRAVGSTSEPERAMTGQLNHRQPKAPATAS
jgi:hypothetical protein